MTHGYWRSLFENIWKLTPDGIFTTKSAYDALIAEEIEPVGGNWRWFWKLPLPSRWLHFLWLVRRDRLLTKAIRARWCMGFDPNCRLCGAGEERIIHILRDCHFSQQVWQQFGAALSEESLVPWMDENLGSKVLFSGVEWRIIFAITLGRLWTIRCSYTMKDEDTSLETHSILANIMSSAIEVMQAFGNCSALNKADLHIQWVAPGDGVVKLNTDGAAKGNPGVAGAGGLIRSSIGTWLMGFQLHLGVCSNMEAELQAIRCGLQLAWSCGYRKLFCESDALVAIDLIQHGNVVLHPLGCLILDIRSLLNRDWDCTLHHTYREGNFCADWLANAACEIDDDFEMLPSPPDAMRSLLDADVRGLSGFTFS